MAHPIYRNVRFWYGIFLSVFTVVLGIITLAAVSDIYFGAEEGAQIFTREIVKEKLFPSFIVFLVWVAAIIGGVVLSAIFPAVQQKRKKAASEDIYRKLKARIPAGSGEEYERKIKQLRQGEIARIVVWCLCAAFCVAAGVIVLVYVFNPNHFNTTEYNKHVLEMAKWVLPCALVSFVWCLTAAITERVVAKGSLPIVKSLIAMGGKPVQKEADGFTVAVQKYEKHFILGVRIALAVLAVALLIWGIFNGGANDVFTKAAAICTECIGLG